MSRDADHKAIDALISKIEVEMLADGASMNLCRYSDEPFNTNEIVWPHWGMAPFHAPTSQLLARSLAWSRQACSHRAGNNAPRRARCCSSCEERRWYGGS